MNRLIEYDPEPIDVREPVRVLCRTLGIDEKYVALINLTPSAIRVVLYRGRDGRCNGPKYVDESTGKTGVEEIIFSEVLA